MGKNCIIAFVHLLRWAGSMRLERHIKYWTPINVDYIPESKLYSSVTKAQNIE